MMMIMTLPTGITYIKQRDRYHWWYYVTIYLFIYL